MIVRIWQGTTTTRDASAYESLLKTKILPDIAARDIPGYHGIQVLRRDVGPEVIFITIMRFETIEAVKAFAGEDFENARVPAKAQDLLKRYDKKAHHYTQAHELSYEPATP